MKSFGSSNRSRSKPLSTGRSILSSPWTTKSEVNCSRILLQSRTLRRCRTVSSFFGVNPRQPNPLVGISNGYDDAKLQQLVTGKIVPRPEFLYYEISAGPCTVGVIQISPMKQRPHIISVDVGKVRKGQIVIRRGSSTDGATLQDLFSFFYGNESQWFAQVRRELGVDAQRVQADAAYLAELRRGSEMAEDEIYAAVGMQPPRRR